jgi:monomeric isocitrate dehydrogenase
VNQLDNRASNFYIALYWADFMAQADPAYKVRVVPLSVFTVFVRCFCALYRTLSQWFFVAVCACQLGNSYYVQTYEQAVAY